MDSYPGTSRLVDLTLAQYVVTLSRAEATPGGGSAAALAGALAGALGAMVAGLTIGREKYAACRDEMITLRKRAEQLQTQFLSLVDADTDAYNEVTAAYRLPKQTEAQQYHRTAAIQTALMEATRVPLAAADACAETLALIARVAEHGNRNAAGDVAVAALLAHAGLAGAARNVSINLGGLQDEAFRTAAASRTAQLLAAGQAALNRALAAADAEI